MRSIPRLAPLALAACASVSQPSAESQSLPARRTIRIENQTIDAVVVRVDGVRVATLLSSESACIAAPEVGRRLTVSAVGDPSIYAAPLFNPDHANGWRWRLRARVSAPAATLDFAPAQPCTLRR
jgi:hypothetical protein